MALTIHNIITVSPTHSVSGSTIRSSITSRGTRVDPVPIPVKTGVIVGVSLTPEKITEHSPQVSNVGFRLEFETAAVGQILSELAGTSLAKGGDGDGLLLFHDKLVLFSGTLGLESLPGEPSLQEVDEDVPDTFKIVATRLLHPQVVVDGSVTRGSGKRPPLTLGDVLKGARVSISLTQSEIDAVNEIAATASSISDEVCRLDITMDQVAGVHELHTLEHLISNHQNRFEGESAAAFVELIFEGRTE